MDYKRVNLAIYLTLITSVLFCLGCASSALVDRSLIYGPLERVFSIPDGIALGQSKTLFVVSYGDNRVVKVDGLGRVDRQFEDRVISSSRLNGPRGIVVDLDGFIYLSEWDGDRILKYDPDGKLILSWGMSGSRDGEFFNPYGMN